MIAVLKREGTAIHQRQCRFPSRLPEHCLWLLGASQVQGAIEAARQAELQEQRRQWMESHPVQIEEAGSIDEWRPGAKSWFKVAGETDQDLEARLSAVKQVQRTASVSPPLCLPSPPLCLPALPSPLSPLPPLPSPPRLLRQQQQQHEPDTDAADDLLPQDGSRQSQQAPQSAKVGTSLASLKVSAAAAVKLKPGFASNTFKYR